MAVAFGLEVLNAALSCAQHAPSIERLICLLQNCRRTRNIACAEHLHAYLCRHELESHKDLGSHLVTMLIECGCLQAAQQVFDRLVYRDDYSWNSLILAHAKGGDMQHALHLYQKMQEDCIHPNRHTFIALLKGCTWLKDVERGQQVLAEVAQKGWKNDLFIGNKLIDMFCKCGSFADAREVFEDLPTQDVVSWNALIAGYSENGMFSEALGCFKQMQLKGICPNAVTFVCNLKACSNIRALERGCWICNEVFERGLEGNVIVGNAMLDMFVKFGSVTEVHKVFNRLPVQDVVSWNTLISGYAEHGCGEDALKCFKLMQLQGLSLDSVTFVCSLKACGSIGDLETGREIWAEVDRLRLQKDVFVASALVDMYCKCSALGEAQELFAKLPVRNVVIWNALIAGYTEHQLSEEALSCIERMQQENVSPNVVTFVCTMKACGIGGSLDQGRQLVTEVLKKGLEKDLTIGRVMVDMFGKCGSIAEAKEAFDRLPERDLVSWSALIAGFIEAGMAEDALSCFEQMQLKGVSPDTFAFDSSLTACGSLNYMTRGQEIYSSIVNHGLEKSMFIGSTLVGIFCRCGALAEAQKIFDSLQVRDIVLWNTLIFGYAEHHLWEDALSCYEKMCSEGVPLDNATYVCILKSCGFSGAIDKGREIYSETVKKNLEKDLPVSAVLVDMFCKCGCLAESETVFDSLPVHNVGMWTALIAGYADQGLGEKVVELLGQMAQDSLSPDVIAFACGLRACTSKGFVEAAREIYLEIVKKGYEQEPLLANMLIDMLGRLGFPAEAWEVFEKLKDRDVGSWNAIVDVCNDCEAYKVALDCCEHMQEQGLSASVVTFTSCLKTCAWMGLLEKGCETCAEIIRKGFERDDVVGKAMVGMFGTLGLLADAQLFFSRMTIRNVDSWSALIAGYSEHGHGMEALACFQKMQQQGVSPDAVSFVCGLKACSSLGATQEVQNVWLQVTKIGLETDHFIGGALVDSLCKQGCLTEAQHVLDKLSVQTVVAWSSLIAGYFDHGLHEEALSCFEKMVSTGVPLDGIVCSCILKACGNLRDLERGQDLHNDITKKGLEIDISVGNGLIEMYGKFGSIAEAEVVFGILSRRDANAWSVMIGEYVDQNLNETALECFEQMKEGRVIPSPATLVAVLRACGSLGNIEKGREIYGDIVIRNLDRDLFVGNTLIDMLARSGSLAEAQEAFEALPVQDLVSWNVLIAGYTEQGFNEEALNCFECMQLQSLSPDAITFANTLKACCRTGSIESGRKIYSQLLLLGLQNDSLVSTRLIDMLGTCGLVLEARTLFQKLSVRSVASWNALITGYASLELGKEALKCFQQMQLEGVIPDTATYIGSLKACCSLGAIENGLEMHTEMVKKGVEKVSSVGNTLVDMYVKCGFLLEAQNLFLKLVVKDVAAWSSMIKGYGMNHQCNRAMQCFKNMHEQGVQLDATVFTCLLATCSHASLICDGQEYFCTIRKQELEWRMDHYACMVDLLARSGCIYEAERLIASIQHPPSEQVWTALLSACKNYGELEMGSKCFWQLAHSNPEDASAYTLMGNIYANADRPQDATILEQRRKYLKARKKLAIAVIELNHEIYEFAVHSNQRGSLSKMLEVLGSSMRGEGYVPNLHVVL